MRYANNSQLFKNKLDKTCDKAWPLDAARRQKVEVEM